MNIEDKAKEDIDIAVKENENKQSKLAEKDFSCVTVVVNK